MTEPSPADRIGTLEEARARLVELESTFDQAIDTIARRDTELEGLHRRLCDLQERLRQAGVDVPDSP